MAKKLYFNNINQYQKEDGYRMNLDIHVPSIQKQIQITFEKID